MTGVNAAETGSSRSAVPIQAGCENGAGPTRRQDPLILLSIFDCPFDLTAGFAGFDGVAAVVEFLAFGESQLDLGMTALGEVDAEGDEGEAFLLCLAEQLVDLF